MSHIPATSFAATAIVVCLFLWALPRGERNRVLRVGAVVYLLACLLCVVVRTPMGSNIERYGVLLAGPLLLCGLAGEGSGSALAGRQERWPARRVARRAASYARAVGGGCGGVCGDGVDRVGAGARDAGGRGIAGDAGRPITRRSSATCSRTARRWSGWRCR